MRSTLYNELQKYSDFGSQLKLFADYWKCRFVKLASFSLWKTNSMVKLIEVGTAVLPDSL